MASIISAGTTSGTAFAVNPDTSGNLAFTTQAGANTITVPNTTGTLITTNTPQSGSVIQVVNGTLNGGGISTLSTSYVTFGASASITPKFSTSKILIIATGTYYLASGNITEYGISITRNGSTIPTAGNDGLMGIYVAGEFAGGYVISILDTPATTSSTSYVVVAQNINSGTSRLYNGVRASQKNIITLMEIAA